MGLRLLESEFRTDQNQAGKENGSEIGNNSETKPEEDSGTDQQPIDLMMVDLANKKWIEGSDARKEGLAQQSKINFPNPNYRLPLQDCTNLSL